MSLNRRLRTSLVSTLALVAGFVGLVAAAPAPSEMKGDPYPYATCAVAGTDLGDDPVVIIHESREVKVCCKKCEAKFLEDPKPILKKLDEQIIKDQLPHYPLTTCVVMAEETLGAESDGTAAEIVDYVHNNRLYRFCCKGCVRKFRKAPEKFAAELDKAVVAAQMEAYPTDLCVVGGGKLGSMGEPVDMVINNRLVRLCCKGCVKRLKADPAKYVAMLGEDK